MGKIEIKGSSEELERISIFLKNNNIKHIINDDFNIEALSEEQQAYNIEMWNKSEKEFNNKHLAGFSMKVSEEDFKNMYSGRGLNKSLAHYTEEELAELRKKSK